MPLPRPMRQRSPIRTTGSLTITWPGTIPADSDTFGPIIVPAPMWMERSLTSAVAGKQMTLPAPKAPKRLPRRVSGTDRAELLDLLPRAVHELADAPLDPGGHTVPRRVGDRWPSQHGRRA